MPKERRKRVEREKPEENSGIKRRREWKDSKQERPKLLKCPHGSPEFSLSLSISVDLTAPGRLFKGREPLKARRFSFITKQTAAWAVT